MTNNLPDSNATIKTWRTSNTRRVEFERHPEHPAVRRIIQTSPYSYRVVDDD